MYGRCVFCSDGNWHCGDTPDAPANYEQCPANVEPGAPCGGWAADASIGLGTCIANCPGNWTARDTCAAPLATRRG
jgi:hypothetical protein